MTRAGFAALRIAATLAHALPGTRVRLRSERRVLLEVAARPGGSGHAMSPCEFRRAVACAHEQTKRGAHVRLMGLPEGVEPTVEFALRVGDQVMPGGIYRVAVGDLILHGFATTLPPRRCRQILAERAAHDEVVRLHHDAATEVTFVHTVGPLSGAAAHCGHLEQLLGAFITDEVTEELTLLAAEH